MKKVLEDEDVCIGDEVILIGQQNGVTIGDTLEHHQIDFVHSERLCLLSERLGRIYLDDENIEAP